MSLVRVLSNQQFRGAELNVQAIIGKNWQSGSQRKKYKQAGYGKMVLVAAVTITKCNQTNEKQTKVTISYINIRIYFYIELFTK